MPTCLMSPCFLDGNDASGGSRLERNCKYINFYRGIQDLIGFDTIALVDNASSEANIIELFTTCDVDLFLQHDTGLRSTGSSYDYPYCWRALHDIKEFMDDFDKIILIDSDGFVLSPRLARFIQECNTGWRSLWCNKYQFPESSMQIINQDSFQRFKDFIGDDYMIHNGRCMETTLPFTHVHTEFNCDRYGEDRVPVKTGMDFYAQTPVDMPMEFKR